MTATVHHLPTAAAHAPAAVLRRTFSGRWYFVSSRDGIAITNWSTRSKALAAARAAGHVVIVGE